MRTYEMPQMIIMMHSEIINNEECVPHFPYLSPSHTRSENRPQINMSESQWASLK